jgi:hypothetical protein
LRGVSINLTSVVLSSFGISLDGTANQCVNANVTIYGNATFCSIDISTADGSTNLEVKGGGIVQVVLTNADGFPVTVSLSEVAYASQGKCNLFSGGIFTKEAKLTGVYNGQYIT